MIFKNKQFVQQVHKNIQGKTQNLREVHKKFSDGSMNKVFSYGEQWYEEYGVKADYVISNGTDNWIDTWLPLTTFKDGVVIELEIEYLTITSAEINAMGAVGGTNTSTRNVVEAGSIVNGRSSFYSYSSTGDWRVSSLDVVPNKKYNFRYEFKNGLQIFYADGVEIRRTTDTVNITSSMIMTLFARNYNNVRQGFVNAKWYSLKMSKLDGTLIADYIPLYVNKKIILDQADNEYAVGNYILVDNVRRKATVLYGEPLDGYINLESEFYFKSISEQNPYYDLGRRIAYGKRIEIPVSFEDTTINPYPLYGLFGSRQGYSQSTAYNTFIGRNDLPMATDVAIDLIPTNRKFTIAIEDGKGYIDGILTTTNTEPVSEWNHNSFLYNINTEGLGGAMTTYRLPIGTRVYGCKIYDVATGVLENAYVPQEDQTLKCALTGEVLPKLGINPTDSWQVESESNVWWQKYGQRADYIENIDNASYIVTDVTPTPNELSLDIECIFLNDITSAPFGCRPTGNASASSNNIFQIDNTIRIDLLGDASLTIPKENNILYNITYSGVDNVFTINGNTHSNSIEKSSTEVVYPFAIFANNSEGVLSVGSACIMRYGKFNINNKQYIPIQVTKEFTDNKGVTHNIGDFIMVNSLTYLDVPTHIGTFTGDSSATPKWWEEYGEQAQAVILDGETNYIDTKTNITGRVDIRISGERLRYDQYEILSGLRYDKDGIYNSAIILGADVDNFAIAEVSNTVPTFTKSEFNSFAKGMTLDGANMKHIYLAGNRTLAYTYLTNDRVIAQLSGFTADEQATSLSFYIGGLNYNGELSNPMQIKISSLTISNVVYIPLKITKKAIIDVDGNIHSVGSYILVRDDEEHVLATYGKSLKGLDGQKFTGSLGYELSSDGTYYINTGIGTYQDYNVVIPETHNGLPVREIKANAYQGNKDIASVNFENVEIVGDYAFADTNIVRAGNIPNATYGIGVFKNCTLLTNIEKHTSINTFTESMFENCSSLTKISIYNISRIEARAFKGCSNLNDFIVSGTTLSFIGEEAFAGCNSLKSIQITANDEKIGVPITELQNINAIPSNIEKIYTQNFLVEDVIAAPVWKDVPNIEVLVGYVEQFNEFAVPAEYLESDGTQYVVGEFVSTYDISTTLKLSGSEPNKIAFGFDTIGIGDQKQIFEIGIDANSKWYMRNETQTFILGDFVANEIVEIRWDKANRDSNTISFNGVVMGTFESVIYSEIVNLFNTNPINTEKGFVGKIYSWIEEDEYGLEINYQPIKLAVETGGYPVGSYLMYDLANSSVTHIPEHIGTFAGN